MKNAPKPEFEADCIRRILAGEKQLFHELNRLCGANRQCDDNVASQVTAKSDKFILPRGFPCNLSPRRHSKVGYHQILRGGRTDHPAFPKPAVQSRAIPE
jgi:hypothetical protein